MVDPRRRRGPKSMGPASGVLSGASKLSVLEAPTQTQRKNLNDRFLGGGRGVKSEALCDCRRARLEEEGPPWRPIEKPRQLEPGVACCCNHLRLLAQSQRSAAHLRRWPCHTSCTYRLSARHLLATIIEAMVSAKLNLDQLSLALQLYKAELKTNAYQCRFLSWAITFCARKIRSLERAGPCKSLAERGRCYLLGGGTDGSYQRHAER